jgi:hypothetical protein
MEPQSPKPQPPEATAPKAAAPEAEAVKLNGSGDRAARLRCRLVCFVKGEGRRVK